MLQFITRFFNSNIVINWIAPLVVTVLGAMIVKVLFDKNKSKSIINSINVANSRFVEAVRPLFIQEIEFNLEIIDDIRNAITREYSVDENMIYTTNQLKEFLILDVAETRYLAEDRKNELISSICDSFRHLKEEKRKVDSIVAPTETIRYEMNNLRKYNLRLLIMFYLTMLSVVLTIVTTKFSEQEIIYEENVIVYIVVAIISVLMGILFVIVDARRKISKSRTTLKEDILQYQRKKTKEKLKK